MIFNYCNKFFISDILIPTTTNILKPIPEKIRVKFEPNFPPLSSTLPQTSPLMTPLSHSSAHTTPFLTPPPTSTSPTIERSQQSPFKPPAGETTSRHAAPLHVKSDQVSECKLNVKH